MLFGRHKGLPVLCSKYSIYANFQESLRFQCALYSLFEQLVQGCLGGVVAKGDVISKPLSL